MEKMKPKNAAGKNEKMIHKSAAGKKHDKKNDTQKCCWKKMIKNDTQKCC